METKIIAIIILLAVLFFAGATTFIYWGSRIQEWRKIFKKAMAEVEAEQANTMQQEKPKEPINLAWVKRHLTVPLILLAIFAIEYVVISSLMGSERVEFLFILVFAMLAMVVLEALGIDKKVPRMRFGIRLGVAILFELFFAFIKCHDNQVFLFVTVLHQCTPLILSVVHFFDQAVLLDFQDCGFL